MSDTELQSLAEKIMMSDPDAASKLQRIQDAADRVARAQAAIKEFEKVRAETLANAAIAELETVGALPPGCFPQGNKAAALFADTRS